MARKIDAARREAMGARSAEARRKAEGILSSLNDPKAKELFRRVIIFRLDDVDGFFLGNPALRPESDDWESRWLDFGQTVLLSAEKALADLEETVKRYGPNLKAL